MRWLLTMGLMLLSVCPQVFANKRDWERVKRLKHGTAVYVILDKGQPVSGRIVGADDRGLRVATVYPWDNGAPEQIARENVRRVVHLRHRILPDPEAMLAGGIVTGGGAGLMAGAISDIRHGNNGRWVTGGLGGAGIGFLGACMTEAGFGVVALFRHDQVVYEATHLRSWSSSGTATTTGNALRPLA